jgi:hypothetical protein
MRSRRLKALGLEQPESKKIQIESPTINQLPSSNAHTCVDVDDRIWRIICEGGGASLSDMARWCSQCFSFAEDFKLGLKQGKGGPCGVLASLQAELLVDLLFASPEIVAADAASFDYHPDAVTGALVHAMSTILERSRSRQDGCYMFVESTLPDIPLYSVLTLRAVVFATRGAFENYLVTNMERILFDESGCLLFLMSLVLTRGVESVELDMDEPSRTLIGPFGHCNQESINLLLTGRATSNVLNSCSYMCLVIANVYQRICSLCAGF